MSPCISSNSENGPCIPEKADNNTHVSIMRLITVRMGHVPFSKLITVRMGRVSLRKRITETMGHATLIQLTNSMIESFRIVSSFLFYCDIVSRVIQEHVSCPCGSGFVSFLMTIYDFCKLFPSCVKSTREVCLFTGGGGYPASGTEVLSGGTVASGQRPFLGGIP